MQTLHVELGDRRYPIFIGSQLNPEQLLAAYIHGKQVMIVTNDTVAPLYLQTYVNALEKLGKQVAHCILPDGEKYKDIEHLNLIFNALLETGFNRDCTVVALGGAWLAIWQVLPLPVYSVGFILFRCRQHYCHRLTQVWVERLVLTILWVKT